MPPVALPLGTRALIALRLFLVQGAWNYETLLGTGIAYAIEPALRHLPGGRNGELYRAAVARHSEYFNAHPYLAGVAVGALANAELSGVPAARITRFRTALSGPLGSIGDRLVWAGMLPCASLVAMLVYAFGGSVPLVVGTFVISYNAGHLALRFWGLGAGLRMGVEVAAALGGELLQMGAAYIMRVAALLAGIAIPMAVARLAHQAGISVVFPLVLTFAAGAAIVLLGRRVQGWFAALVLLVVYALLTLFI